MDKTAEHTLRIGEYFFDVGTEYTCPKQHVVLGFAPNGYVVGLDPKTVAAIIVPFDKVCPACADPKFIVSHTPSRYCRSGKHPHCTCDSCF